MITLDWKPHPHLSDHYRAQYKGHSIIQGAFVSVDKKFEVMEPNGDIRRFNNEAEVLQYLGVK